MINLLFDMETADPDDVLTLCMISNYPQVNLVGVTVTPGSRHQIGLVKHVLSKLEKDIPVGSKNKEHPKECVSAFHYNWLGNIGPAEPDGTGAEIIAQAIAKYPNLNIVCGASLGNIAAALEAGVTIERLVIQGGFAGDNIMPPELVLEKFRGKITCPTFNLNGDVPAALKVLASTNVRNRIAVSKNVCHGVVYDQTMHEFMLPHKGKNIGLDLMIDGMTKYLRKTPSGKAFHDPLAACVTINQNVCTLVPVELYREKGNWGSKISNNLNVSISIAVDMDLFRQTIIG